MIKGITPTLAEGGKIKIGGLGPEREKVGGGKYRIPLKYSYFLVTSNDRDAKGDLAINQAIMDALPKNDEGQVKELPVIVHSDEIDEVFPTVYAAYSGKKLVCSGDGEKATRWEMKSGVRTGEKKDIPCTCPLLEQGKCKPHGTFHCSVTAPGQAVAGSVHKWRTTSKMSLDRMIGSILAIKKVTGGTLAGLPLVLKIEGIYVTPDNATASTVYVCHLELRAADMQAAQQMVFDQRAMRKALANPDADSNYRLMIRPPAGAHEDAAEMREIQEEFYPDASDEAVIAPEDEEDLKNAELLMSKAAAEGSEAFAKQWAALSPRDRRLISPSKLDELKGKVNHGI